MPLGDLAGLGEKPKSGLELGGGTIFATAERLLPCRDLRRFYFSLGDFEIRARLNNELGTLVGEGSGEVGRTQKRVLFESLWIGVSKRGRCDVGGVPSQ